MRKIRINLSNRIYFTLASLILVLILILGVHAYGTSDPPVFGHSAGELEGVAIPSGAIMAFNLVSCPSGWSALTSANGRVVAGLDTGQVEFDNLGETGGEKTHLLTIAEMPIHRHQKFHDTGAAGAGIYENSWAGVSGATTTQAGYTDYTGGNAPHNNLPPYVTYLYCIKN